MQRTEDRLLGETVSSLEISSVEECTVYVQSNLCTTTTLGTQNLWPLLTGSRCSEVTLSYKINNGTPKWWSLLTSGRYLEVVVNSCLTVR